MLNKSFIVWPLFTSLLLLASKSTVVLNLIMFTYTLWLRTQPLPATWFVWRRILWHHKLLLLNSTAKSSAVGYLLGSCFTCFFPCRISFLLQHDLVRVSDWSVLTLMHMLLDRCAAHCEWTSWHPQSYVCQAKLADTSYGWCDVESEESHSSHGLVQYLRVKVRRTFRPQRSPTRAADFGATQSSIARRSRKLLRELHSKDLGLDEPFQVSARISFQANAATQSEFKDFSGPFASYKRWTR